MTLIPFKTAILLQLHGISIEYKDIPSLFKKILNLNLNKNNKNNNNNLAILKTTITTWLVVKNSFKPLNSWSRVSKHPENGQIFKKTYFLLNKMSNIPFGNAKSPIFRFLIWPFSMQIIQNQLIYHLYIYKSIVWNSFFEREQVLRKRS